MNRDHPFEHARSKGPAHPCLDWRGTIGAILRRAARWWRVIGTVVVVALSILAAVVIDAPRRQARHEVARALTDLRVRISLGITRPDLQAARVKLHVLCRARPGLLSPSELTAFVSLDDYVEVTLNYWGRMIEKNVPTDFFSLPLSTNLTKIDASAAVLESALR